MAPVTPRIEYSPHKRTRIQMKYELGISQRQIAFQEGVPKGSVSGIIKRYRQQSSAKSSPRAGRLTKLSENDKRLLFRSISKDPFISIEDLLRESQLNVSAKTLSRWLKSEGILHKHALRRPLLTPKAAKKRLQFAIEHSTKDINFWRRWIFSDETTIARGEGERQAWVHCPKAR